jgi:ribonuclease BN (tRNA processing enzyme)
MGILCAFLGDSTGTESVYTMFEGHEIMFHVSTLLPYSKENKQQVHRNEHTYPNIQGLVFTEEGRYYYY